MELTEVDIKSTIPADDNIPDKSFFTVPPAGYTGKLKYSRYEDVWPEDVHAAFMEAVALYPPMGKRRLKYYRVSECENEHALDANRLKSFGRCQLIQSYILEKTGKNRSRKQVSSHLQRLKKIYKDNPAMQPLFSERPQLPSDSEHCSAPQTVTSQDRSKNISVSPSHFNSDFDLSVNFQKTDAPGSSTYPFAPEASSPIPSNEGPCHALNSSTTFHNRPSQEFLSPVPRRRPTIALSSSSNSDYLSELNDMSFFKDAMNEGTRSGSAFNTPGLPSSARRFTSKLPVQARLADAGPTTYFSRAAHSLGFQTIPQWISHDSLMDGVYYNSPLTAAQEAFHTPYLPLQSMPSERQRLYPGLASDWLWSKDPDLSFDPREGSFAELRLRYPSTMYHYDPQLAYPELRDSTPGFNTSPSEDEISRFPRRISYSYALTNPATPCETSRFPSLEVSYSYVVPSPTTIPDNVLNEDAIDFLKRSPESSEDFASHFVIRPTPVYPVSFVHSDTHSNIHSDSFTPAPRSPP